MALKEEDHTVSLELIKAFDDKENPMITTITYAPRRVGWLVGWSVIIL